MGGGGTGRAAASQRTQPRAQQGRVRRGQRRRAHKEGGWGCSALTGAGAVHARGLAARTSKGALQARKTRSGPRMLSGSSGEVLPRAASCGAALPRAAPAQRRCVLHRLRPGALGGGAYAASPWASAVGRGLARPPGLHLRAATCGQVPKALYRPLLGLHRSKSPQCSLSSHSRLHSWPPRRFGLPRRAVVC